MANYVIMDQDKFLAARQELVKLMAALQRPGLEARLNLAKNIENITSQHCEVEIQDNRIVRIL